MKFILPLFILLFLGCSDDDLNSYRIDHDIVGKWQLEATKISPGGIVDWSDVKDGEIYEFKSDGTMVLSKWDDCKAPINGSFIIQEDKLFLEFSCNLTQYEPVYNRSFEEGKLILGYMGCIEECSYRYKPIE